jgi:hypothetical protein
VCQAKEFRFCILNSGEPLNVLEQECHFLEKV